MSTSTIRIAEKLANASTFLGIRKCQNVTGEESPIYETVDGDVEYSNEFERRLYLCLGVSGIVLGSSALMANASMHLWQQGAVLNSVTDILMADLSSNEAYKSFYNSIFIVLIARATISFAAAVVASTLIFSVYPNSKRHWRHMTPTVWISYTFMLMAYGAFGIFGATVSDILFVLAPALTGLWSLFVAASMDMAAGEEGLISLSDSPKEENRGVIN